SGRDDRIRCGNARIEDFLLLAFLLFRELASVASRALRAHTRVDELRAERLHLFLGRAAHVVRFHHCAQPSCRSYSLQSRDSCSAFTSVALACGCMNPTTTAPVFRR